MRSTTHTKKYSPAFEAEIAARQISYGESRSQAVSQLRGPVGLAGAIIIKAIMGSVFIIWFGSALLFGEDWGQELREQTLYGGLAAGWIAGAFVAFWARSKALWGLHIFLAIPIAMLVSSLFMGE